jgi:hypothetical protein
MKTSPYCTYPVRCANFVRRRITHARSRTQRVYLEVMQALLTRLNEHHELRTCMSRCFDPQSDRQMRGGKDLKNMACRAAGATSLWFSSLEPRTSPLSYVIFNENMLHSARTKSGIEKQNRPDGSCMDGYLFRWSMAPEPDQRLAASLLSKSHAPLGERRSLSLAAAATPKSQVQVARAHRTRLSSPWARRIYRGRVGGKALVSWLVGEDGWLICIVPRIGDVEAGTNCEFMQGVNPAEGIVGD